MKIRKVSSDKVVSIQINKQGFLMYLSNKLIKAVFSGTGVAVILAGCSASPSTKPLSSPLALPDTLIAENKGDIEALYSSWIEPFKSYKDHYIPHINDEQLLASEAAVIDGFSRFCFTSGGAVTHRIDEYGGYKYRCSTSNSRFIGEFTINFLDDNPTQLLHVKIDSPKRLEAREALLKVFETRKSKNGPTGVIVTDEGRFKFLRIGNLKERHVLEVLLEKGTNKYIPIEDISQIKFSENAHGLNVTLRNGRNKSLNTMHLVNRTSPNLLSAYKSSDFPVVMIDPESEQPYTKIFSNLNSIKSIFFDDTSVWNTEAAAVITTTFDPLSPSRLNTYTQKLRVEANKLYSEAIDNGWIKLLPDGKLTLQLVNHLKYELRKISKSSECNDNAVIGITSLDTLLRCRVATRELKLIAGKGYSLVTEVTPLATIIVLNKIKKDLL
ncbi:hypothetical protein RB215_02305 [Pseudoalteromonas sp. HL-AS2]|uniref:hypothetical protein n=1 Tax=Pseudoalteromonas sp. HL-AS2 TaxID=3071082 RepID=UPI0028153A08|nr:hypothetical protein [Pseudoalteromonas sp. HL-AS2]WMS94928.1 hypothetical protein RB215_02305 [Pseudoalteromonas sp. HL-AS2]